MAHAPHADEAPISTARATFGTLAMLALCAVATAVFILAVNWLQLRHSPLFFAAAAVYFAVLIVISRAHYRSRAAAAFVPLSAAGRRYRRRQTVAICLYLVAMLIALAVRVRHPPALLTYAAALLVIAPVIGMVATMGLYLRDETDEVERSILMQSGLWATGAVLALTAAWGQLELFGLAPYAPMWTVFPAWIVALTVAKFAIRQRYR